MNLIADNVRHIRATLGDARLIAVSKRQSAAAIEMALQAGQRAFGENRVQEAVVKFPSLRRRYSDIELHMIGPLQSNKAGQAVQLFDVIQTLDRPPLADALAIAIAKQGRRPRLYVQINIGGEPQKSGLAPEELSDFLIYCRQKSLTVSGLMCIPPAAQDPLPFFHKMRALADEFVLPNLSMGMSGDYQAAISCGATEVRIGSAIFGDRI